jgi:hypothetical protein
MYFDIFSRKLGSVLGRRAAVAMIADHISADRLIVAFDGEKIVGWESQGLSTTTPASLLPNVVGS